MLRGGVASGTSPDFPYSGAVCVGVMARPVGWAPRNAMAPTASRSLRSGAMGVEVGELVGRERELTLIGELPRPCARGRWQRAHAPRRARCREDLAARRGSPARRRLHDRRVLRRGVGGRDPVQRGSRAGEADRAARRRAAAPQRRELDAALGRRDSEAVQGFHVHAAALSLILEATRERPVLVIADDLQWIDAVSAQTLAFVGRRISAEPVAMLAATRPGGRLPGLPSRSTCSPWTARPSASSPPASSEAAHCRTPPSTRSRGPRAATRSPSPRAPPTPAIASGCGVPSSTGRCRSARSSSGDSPADSMDCRRRASPRPCWWPRASPTTTPRSGRRWWPAGSPRPRCCRASISGCSSSARPVALLASAPAFDRAPPLPG